MDFGIRKGFEIGSELGFYTGCIQVSQGVQAFAWQAVLTASTSRCHTQVWQLLSQTPGSTVSDRTAKAIAAVQQQLSDISVSPQVWPTSYARTYAAVGLLHPVCGPVSAFLLPYPWLKHYLQDQNLPEVMAQLRGKVKAIAASLGLLQHYFPAAQPSQLDM